MAQWAWFDRVTRDLRHTFRMLVKSPTFTLVAIISLALGIGANTAIFQIVHAVMLRSLPVESPQQLVQLGVGDRQTVMTNAIWEEIRNRQSVFEGVLAYARSRFDVGSDGEKTHVEGLYVSGSFFATLGVTAAAGRLITPDDDRRGGGTHGPVAVLSHDYWRNRHHASPAVVGSTIRLDGHPVTVIGVVSAGFFGVSVGHRFDVAVPLAVESLIRGRGSLLDRRTSWWLTVLGRLPAQTSREQAHASLRALAPRIREATMPPEYAWKAERDRYLSDAFTLTSASSGSSSLRGRYRTALLTVMSLVAIVLLIACANLANLLLARASARRRELAVRLAVGASRAQLVRQQLTESLVLASAGAALGMPFAGWASHLIVRQLSSTQAPMFLDLSVDWPILGFAIALAVSTAVIIGVAPALRSTDVCATDLLRSHVRSSVAGWRGFSLEKLLVVVQIAFSLVLVVGAGLFVRSFATLATVDPGFDPQQLIVASIDARRVQGPAQRRRMEVHRVLEALQQLPHVRSVASTVMVPLTQTSWTSTVHTRGAAPLTKPVFMNRVGPRYFATLGAPMIAGRDFGSLDAPQTPPVAIVNEAFARTFFGSGRPIGSTFELSSAKGTPFRIVGIVKDHKYLDFRQTAPETVYLAMDQHAEPTSYFSLIIRGTHDIARQTQSMTTAIRSVNQGFTVEFHRFDTIVQDSMMQERLLAMLAGFFGALALLVAVIGLYGVTSLAVSRRRSEIGVRLALGARPSSVVQLVLRDVATVMLAGIAVGAVAATLSGRLVRTLLFDLHPGDVTTWVLAIGALGASAALAGYLPAWRVSRVDPLIVLRDE